MIRDQYDRPVCNGRRSGGAVRCTEPVHPGYTLCPTCLRPYTREQLQAALQHPQNESFRRLHGAAQS